MFKTNKEIGAEIRAKIKAAGIPARSVSVRVQYAGYSTSINVRIKDISVGRKQVEKIAKEYRDVSYDERSGEILEGGNTYVFVDYDYEMMTAERNKHLETARDIVTAHRGNEGVEIARNKNSGTRAVYFPASSVICAFANDNLNTDMHPHAFSDLGRYYAHNEYDIASALALFNAHGSFTA